MEKDKKYFQEGCPDCGLVRKIQVMEERTNNLYPVLIEKIDTLNVNIKSLIEIVTNHKVEIATLKEKKDEHGVKIEKIEERQYEIVKEVNQTIGKRTLVPILISVLTLVILSLTLVVTYIK